MTKHQGGVVVIGDALIDEMRNETGSVDAPGGSALNVAVGLAILGVPTTLIAMIGDDGDGRTLLDYAESFGIEVLASPSILGTGRAVSDRTEGEPTYFFSDAALARSLKLGPQEQAAIDAASVVAVSGFPFDDFDEFNALADALVTHGSVLVDPNPRTGFLRDSTDFAANLERLASTIALLKIGDEDAALLYSLPVAEVAEHYRSLGTAAVLATEGPAGAAVHIGDHRLHRPIASDPRPIIDTMGAGDSTFASVIAQAVRSGSVDAIDDWDSALENAMAIAAETVRAPGGQLQLPSN
jgi:fructokinase